jgi:hypothetical protein
MWRTPQNTSSWAIFRGYSSLLPYTVKTLIVWHDKITYLGPTVLAPEDGNDIYRPDGNTKVPYAINYRKPPSITVGGFVLNPDKKAHTFELDINIYLSALKKTSSVKLGTAPILCTFGTSAEWKKAKPMPSHFVVVIGNITDIIFKTKGSKSQKGTVDRFVITIKDIISTGSQSVPPATALPDSLDCECRSIFLSSCYC